MSKSGWLGWIRWLRLNSLLKIFGQEKRGQESDRRLHARAICSCQYATYLLCFKRYQRPYMRTVKYVGEPKNIGRFGEVKKGQELVLTEGEWDCVEQDPAYKLLSGDVNSEAMSLGDGVLPIGTPVFDLRTIPWENPNVFNRLTARASRNQLRGIIDAMRLAGAVVTEPNYDGEKLFVVDAIIAASKNMQWHRYTETQRLQMPRLEDDGTGNLVLRYYADNEHSVPTIQGDFPAPRFDKNGAELVSPQVDANAETQAEEKPKSSKKLKTITSFRKRSKPEPALT